MKLQLKKKSQKLSLSRGKVKAFSPELAEKMRKEGVTSLELLVRIAGKGEDAQYEFGDMEGLPAEFVSFLKKQDESEFDLEELLGDSEDFEALSGAIAECMKGKGKRKKKAEDEEDEDEEEMADDDGAQDYEANVIRGVEIFAAGKHNGDMYSTADLDEMVQAFNKLDYKPALKIGHTKKPGHPAYGYIDNLRRVGPKLVADFTDVADEVMDYIRRKMFNRVSAEVYWNFQRGKEKFKRALKAVALLGAEVPGVAGLKPLHESEFDAEDFESVKAFSVEIEIPETAFYDAVVERMTAITKHLSKEKEMPKGHKKELEQQIEELQKQIEKLESGDAKELRVKLNSAMKALKTLQEDKDERDLKEKVEKLRVPAFKSQVEALYRHALAADEDATVEVYTTNSEGKRTKQDITMVEAVDSLVESINKQAEKLFKALSAGSGQRRSEDGDDDAAQRVHTETLAYMQKHPEAKLTYEKAMAQVLRGDKELKAAYEAQVARQ